ncbi:AlkA N-terminal domain-containing protein [Nocardiopsis sp. LOL_012]|uniref:AlkA N-terminal domain-containing protein n=1 Tax=Nocardiopsis sp. LOL_012 TaxID=3345409 RepID=UPI003A840B40
MDDDQRYRAVRSRDARFDGVFYTAVRTTGIYCRPSCPAVTPKRVNTRFYPSSAAAQEAGFRACKRCRPDRVPGSPEWNLRADAVGRAMRLIRDGAVDRGGVRALADAVGYSERQLHRLLTAEVGAGPLALARAERAQTARVLVETTTMPMADIAFASGFSSVRQFNETMRAVFDRAPTRMRGRGTARKNPGALLLRLPYREPGDVPGTLRFLGERAVPGIEKYADGTYRRTLTLPHGVGIVELSAGDGYVRCRLRLTEPRDLTTAVRRCRSLLDLDADPVAVAEAFAGDGVLAPLVGARPGVRSPGHVDPAELAVRAVLGQQVSVAAARTLAGRLVRDHGAPLPEGLAAVGSGLTHTFPAPETLAAADPARLSVPLARGQTLTALAASIAKEEIDLGPGCDREETQRRLLGLRGIGPWTAHYIRMRGLGDPDVLLAGDLGVRKALGSAEGARSWSPWRSYATHLLWTSLEKD